MSEEKKELLDQVSEKAAEAFDKAKEVGANVADKFKTSSVGKEIFGEDGKLDKDDLKRMKIICFLRELDLPIDAIS